MRYLIAITFTVSMLLSVTQTFSADWKPATGPLMTRWAKDVSPANALPEYPRPQMVRQKWQNLNGLWQFAAAKESDQPPIGKDLSEQILVPYPVESALSGLMRHEERMWYRRTFEIPADWKGQHVLLPLGRNPDASVTDRRGQGYCPDHPSDQSSTR